LIVGNEKTGVTKNLLKYCDQAIELPMQGKKKSLNVFQKTENINIALTGAKSIGCIVINIGARPILAFNIPFFLYSSNSGVSKPPPSLSLIGNL
jgi:hypothetical protein